MPCAANATGVVTRSCGVARPLPLPPAQLTFARLVFEAEAPAFDVWRLRPSARARCCGGAPTGAVHALAGADDVSKGASNAPAGAVTAPVGWGGGVRLLSALTACGAVAASAGAVVQLSGAGYVCCCWCESNRFGPPSWARHVGVGCVSLFAL